MKKLLAGLSLFSTLILIGLNGIHGSAIAGNAASKEPAIRFERRILEGFIMPQFADLHKNIRWEELEELYRAPWADELTVVDEEGNAHIAKSCPDLKGIPDFSDTRPASHFPHLIIAVVTCRTTEEMVKATPASKSFVEGFSLTRQTPAVLPANFHLQVNDQDIEETRRAHLWGELIKVTSFEARPPYAATYSDSSRGSEQTLALVAKADFDGDGLEDLMISSSEGLAGGSWSNYRVLVVTRLGKNEPLRLIREISISS